MNNTLFKTSTIADGNMSFRFGEAHTVIENRRRFLAHHAIPFENHTCMRCNHGEHIVRIMKPSPNTMPDAEVLVTNQKNCALMLLTADCLPTAFYDEEHEVIALAHLNRKTIAHNLGQKTVSFLTKHFGTRPEKLHIHIGPHIKKESYSFPLPLTEPTPSQLAHHMHLLSGNMHLDLVGAETEQLTAVGVQQNNISISPIDTYTSPEHFSHYESTRDTTKPHGRIASILMIVS